MKHPDIQDQLAGLDFEALQARIQQVSPREVQRTLGRERLRPRDVALLVSPAAAEQLDQLCARAAAITEQRFGRVMQLYAPLYLSSECTNRCAYCGFACDTDIPRRSLSVEEAVDNARVLHAEGFRQLLLVTGEAPRSYGVDRIEEVVRALEPLFDSISIEIFPMDTGDYSRLAAAGVDGLVLYQETYHRGFYQRVHLGGRKTDYGWRLDGPHRGGLAGYRSLGLGVLLGLAPWRTDVLALALHAAWLQRRHWRSRVAVSFPRLVHSERGFTASHTVSDSELIQAMVALRLVLPDAEIVLSTREPATLRDRLVGCCVTRMSAGSRTSPGGYLSDDPGEQFQAQDTRPPAEVARMLTKRGIDPVWKDMDRSFRT